MITQCEAEQLTGLKLGGISALALLNRRFRVFLDAAYRHWRRFSSALACAASTWGGEPRN